MSCGSGREVPCHYEVGEEVWLYGEEEGHEVEEGQYAPRNHGAVFE